MIYKIDYDAMIIPETLDGCIRRVTSEVLAPYNQENHPSYEDVTEKILNEEKKFINYVNANTDKKIKVPQSLLVPQIADILLCFNHIVRIRLSKDSNATMSSKVALYDKEEGIYVFDDERIMKEALKLNCLLTEKDLHEIMFKLSLYAPKRLRTIDPDIIPVNNGIFDFKNKVLMDFSPEYIFIAKSPVNYNASAKNVVIHNADGTDWDLESWMESLSDDPEIVELLWEVMSAILRPFVRWNQSVWLYSERGNNGKGTFCRLLRNLCGEQNTTSIALNEFSKRFSLGGLLDKTAIVTDENDVGCYIDQCAILKSLITNDVVKIEKKFIDEICYRFYGLVVECLNSYPRIKDKSNSFYRRQKFIPFEKCFEGNERKYIKADYLERKEVLEYAMYKVMNMNFYEFSEPEACKDALSEYKEINDPVRQFLDEILEQLVWDLVPFTFLYELYKVWFKKANPSGTIQGRTTFITEVLNIIEDYPEWWCKGRSVKTRRKSMMDKTELLIYEYDLRDWQDKTYIGADINKICTPKLNEAYPGLLRRDSSENTD